MTREPSEASRRNVPIMAGQGALSVMAWSMASPSVVLTFLAVSLELPIFLAGLLVSLRHAAGTLSDVFAADAIARLPRKKAAIMRADLAVAACFFLVIVVAAYGSQSLIMVTFVVAILLIGVIEEVKSLLILDFLSDNLPSADRMRVSYTQKALGGAATIAIVLLAHQLMQDAPALSRHTAIVAIGAACFVLSATFVLALRERTTRDDKVPSPAISRAEAFKAFWRDAGLLLRARWFRNYMVIRLTFVLAGLSVPFYALIAAEAHHGSALGLTALVVSSAAALMVAAPLWQTLSGYSNRVVMVAGAAMVAVSGVALIVIHFMGYDHSVHLHAVSLFVVTIAVTGLGSARTLYFMDIAPKSQRIAAQAVSKTIGRLAIIVFSAGLAAIAHANEIVWAVVAISLGSLLAIVVILSFVEPSGETAASHGQRDAS